MNESQIRKLLENVREGSIDIAEAVKQLKGWPSETTDFACLDHQRALRTGFPEVVYGEDKSAEQIGLIFDAMLDKPSLVMATRVSPEKAEKICNKIKGLTYHETAGMLIGNIEKKVDQECRGTILVISAGTSDMAVAEEAFFTARYLGHPVDKLYDVGVAGLHRVMSQREALSSAAVLIVVAGMEGALPSVVAGLVDKPVIAVPTSVGYGASFGGITALLGMLNSCAPGVATVNIDNGFGAGCMAAAINRQ
ncbi:MAG: nickel pincer cofactor biosynthesis protein LarB [Deltaproteobacteria bacterium]|jgi:NCAIR mutase (PurE)-related protein|nr:nickel pincer cofactor biosynthesis protein LarB [Deltaproteobacteria bacterium]